MKIFEKYKIFKKYPNKQLKIYSKTNPLEASEDVQLYLFAKQKWNDVYKFLKD